MESASKYKQPADDKLGHRGRLNSTGVGDQDLSSGKLLQRQDPNRCCRGMDPSKEWGVLDHRGRQAGCERHVGRFNPAHGFRIGNGMCESHVWKSFPQPLDLRFWDPPKLDRPDCKDEDIHAE